jgi:hypothetical protein
VADPTPLEDLVVNDRYWLARAREMVTVSIRARDEAAGRLATAIGWFWTVYTAAALVGVSLTGGSLPRLLGGLLALPVFLLVLAYALVVWAMTPIGTTFDPRVPEEIAAAHSRGSRTKQRRLAVATGVTLAAALAVAAAVAAAATIRAETSPSLHATRSTGERPAQDVVLVRGRFPPGQAVTLVVTPQAGKGSPVKQLEIAGQDGVVRVSIPVPAGGGYDVAASWTDASGRWSLSRTVSAATGATTTTMPP